MSMSNTAETALLTLLFENTAWANVGDAAGLLPSAADGNFYISLHTGDPGEAGDQTTSECTYTGYARVAVTRDAAGFTVAGNTVSNAAAVTFGACTVGAETASHFSVGRDAAGAGMIIVSGAISNPVGGLAISPGITPAFAIGAMTATAD